MERQAANLEEFKQATRSKLAAVRCPDHRQAPRLRFNGQSIRDVTISLSGCCRKVMALANEAIRSA